MRVMTNYMLLRLLIVGWCFLAFAASAGEPVFETIPDIDDDRRQVEMLWRTPDDGTGPWPAILFVHGFQPREDDAPFAPGAKAMLEVPPRYPLFEMFRQKGYLVAAVSHAGYGDTDAPLDFCGPLTQQAIATAIAALRRHPDVLSDRVFLHGRSRGAVASGMVATRDTGVAAVVLESGIYDLKSEYENLLTKPTDPYIYIAANIELEAGKTDEVFEERSVVLSERGIHVPTLIIHGSDDLNAPVLQAVRLDEYLRELDGDVSLAIFDDEGHQVPVDKTAPLIEEFIGRVTNAVTTSQSR